jgi:two-component system, OmpR family, response regulator
MLRKLRSPDGEEVPMPRVLLVEDDDVLRANYETLLGKHRLSVRSCATKTEAISAFEQEKFDTIILDVTLGSDYEAGFSLCRLFRERQKAVPIIFLTEHDDDANKISGLRLDADDFLSKTISSAFLVARINALMRRVETLVGVNGSTNGPDRTANESRLRIDNQTSRAFWSRQALDLSLTQFWILRDLYEHSGVVRSTEDLMRAAHITVQPNTIVFHIKAIRQQLQKHCPTFSSIKSERARGYRWIHDDIERS